MASGTFRSGIASYLGNNEDSRMLEFQQRVVEEKAQLDERLQKLCSFCVSDKFKELPLIEQGRLCQQRMAMALYSSVLAARIADFKSNVPLS